MTPQDFFGSAKPMAYIPAAHEFPGVTNHNVFPGVYPYAVFGIDGKPAFSLSINIETNDLVLRLASVGFYVDPTAGTLGESLLPKTSWSDRVTNIPLPAGYTVVDVKNCLNADSLDEKAKLLAAALSTTMSPPLDYLRGSRQEFDRHCNALAILFKEKLSFAVAKTRNEYLSLSNGTLDFWAHPHRAKKAIDHALLWFQPAGIRNQVIESKFRGEYRHLTYTPAVSPTGHEMAAAARLIRDFYDAHKADLKITKKWLDGFKARIGI